MSTTLHDAEDGIESSDFELNPLVADTDKKPVGRYWKMIIVSMGAVAVVVMATRSDKHVTGVDVDGFMEADEECDETKSGWKDEDYRGCQNVARNGKICQGWYTIVPNPHHYLPGVYAHKGIGIHNYCRNPSGSDSIWCYVTNVGWMGKRWEYCDPLKAGETSAPTPAPTTTATEPPPPTPAPEPDETTTSTTTTINEEKIEEEEAANESEAIKNGTEVPPQTNPGHCFDKGIMCKDENHGPARWPYCGFRLMATPELCQTECQNVPQCQHFSWHHHLCFLLTFKGSTCYNVTGAAWEGYTTGPKECPLATRRLSV